jgi:uncharacterized protein YutE (UPF0331/DUF86 family)
MAGCVRRLGASHAKLRKLFPLDAERLESLSADDEEAIDAFLKRFEQLVATVQDQVFKGIAIAEGEDTRAMSRRDATERMEQLGVIPSAATFREIVVIRNRLAHIYADDPARQAAILNAAFARGDDALAAARQITDFAQARHYR